VNNAVSMPDELRNVVRGKIIEGAPMSRYTTIKVGGPADMLFVPADEADLMAALKIAERERLPYQVLGAGSDLIVRDGGIEGLTVLLRGTMDDVEIEGESIKCGAGAILPKLARMAAQEGLTGLEWAASIPGTVGGAVVGNAGAFGSDMAGVLAEARIRLPGGKVETRNKESIEFSYRSSNISPGAVALSAVLKLEKGDGSKIEKRMKDMTEKRKSTQPLHEPSAGSIFRNPPGENAGRIIDSMGLKGKRLGGAMISKVHANFIVNLGDATAADVIGLMNQVCDEVRNVHNIELEPEVRIIGREVAP